MRSRILIFVIIVIIAVLIIVIVARRREALDNSGTPGLNDGSIVSVWSTPVPSDDPTVNSCRLYQFSAIPLTSGGNLTYLSASPNFNSLQSGTVPSTSSLPPCVDSDQLVAQEVTHTCIVPVGISTDANPNLCKTLTNGLASIGSTETYYSGANCRTIGACAGQLSLLSVNFQAPTVPITNTLCISNGLGSNSQMAYCDPTDTTQIFRLTRVNPGQDPNTLKPGQGQSGPVAQLFHRSSGLCLTGDPNGNTGPSPFLPNYIPGCSSSLPTATGLLLVLEECSGLPNDGYMWYMLPSGEYNGNIVPQQIVDITGITTAQLVAATNYTELIDLLISTQAQSMYFGVELGTMGALPILQPLALDATQCSDLAQTSQYINLAIFNSIVNESACLGSTNPGCYGF